MGRILALDYGRKRVGIAVTDPLQISANGLETVSSGKIIEYLRSYFITEKVELVVIGYPKKMNNEESEAVIYINSFVKEFKKNFPEVPIEYVDERFTSKMATKAIRDAGARKKVRRDKALIDKVSATIILQSYLEFRSNVSIKQK